MIPYNQGNWENWFQQYVLQTQCEYTAQNGSKSNNQSREKGVIKVNKDQFTYISSWVHTYMCLRGGEGKFHPLSLKKSHAFLLALDVLDVKHVFTLDF